MGSLKIFDENGKELHISDIVNRLSPDTLNKKIVTFKDCQTYNSLSELEKY